MLSCAAVDSEPPCTGQTEAATAVTVDAMQRALIQAVGVLGRPQNESTVSCAVEVMLCARPLISFMQHGAHMKTITSC
jgi:hypothetical protein